MHSVFENVFKWVKVLKHCLDMLYMPVFRGILKYVTSRLQQNKSQEETFTMLWNTHMAAWHPVNISSNVSVTIRGIT